MPQNRLSVRFSVLQKVQSITLGNTCSGQKEMFHKQLGYLIKMTAASDWLQSGILAFFETFLAGISFSSTLGRKNTRRRAGAFSCSRSNALQRIINQSDRFGTTCGNRPAGGYELWIRSRWHSSGAGGRLS